MPLDIDDVIENPPKPVPKPAPKREEIDPRILAHPRVVAPTVKGDEFFALKDKGILAFDPQYKPSKFRLYSHASTKDKCKAIPFAAWSRKKKCWIVPISIETLRFMSKSFPEFLMTPDAFKMVARVKESAKQEREMILGLRDIKAGKLDDDFVMDIEGFGVLQPRDYQKTCIAATEWAWSYGYGIGNFSEQGVGKTCTTLVTLDRAFAKNPDGLAVVFAPKSILHTTWVSECLKFSQHIRPFVPWGSVPKRGERALHTVQYDWEEEYELDGIARTRFVKRNGTPNLILLNHEAGQARDRNDPAKHNAFILALGRLLERAGEDSYLVIDEGHKFSNAEAKQTKAAAYLANMASNVLLMTGTPGMPEKYYGILRLIDKRIYNINKTDFERRYVERTDLGDFTKITGYNRLNELQRRSDQFSIRFKQEDCADIPDHSRVEMEIDLSSEQQKAYDDIADQVETYYDDHNITKESLGAKLHGLRNVCSGFVKNDEGEYVHFKSNNKLKALMEALDDELEANPNHPEHIRKAVVTCQYKEDVKIITQAMDKKGLKYVVVTSQVVDKPNDMARSNAVKAWVEDPEVRVFIGTEPAFKEGLNLVPKLPQVCDVMFIYSSGYRPDARDQVEKRIIRSGQTRMVRIIEMMCKSTIDESIVDAIKVKKNICSIVNGDNLRRVLRGRQAE